MDKLLNVYCNTFPMSTLFNNIKVPEKFGAFFCDYGKEDISGTDMTYEERDKIWEAVEDFYRFGAHPGVFICIRYQGKVVLNRSIGYSRGGIGQKKSMIATTDTPVCLFSASKAVAAMLVHKLVEEGEIHLDAPVSHYVPEFGRNGKEMITIDDLLQHKSGIPHLNLHSLVSITDHEKVMDTLYEMKPSYLAKGKQAYHAISLGHLIVEIVKRVTGRCFHEVHDEYFRKPMDMDYFTFGISEDISHNVAYNYSTGMKVKFPFSYLLKRALGFNIQDVIESTNTAEFRNATVPAGNMFATAEELSRFYQMLLNGGRYKNKQILKPETIQRAIRSPEGHSLDRTLLLPLKFSRGFLLGGGPMHLYGSNSPLAFGHPGMMNIFAWADPQNELSCALLNNGKPALGPHLIGLRRLMNTISNKGKA